MDMGNIFFFISSVFFFNSVSFCNQQDMNQLKTRKETLQFSLCATPQLKLVNQDEPLCQEVLVGMKHLPKKFPKLRLYVASLCMGGSGKERVQITSPRI